MLTAVCELINWKAVDCYAEADTSKKNFVNCEMKLFNEIETNTHFRFLQLRENSNIRFETHIKYKYFEYFLQNRL